MRHSGGASPFIKLPKFHVKHTTLPSREGKKQNACEKNKKKPQQQLLSQWSDLMRLQLTGRVYTICGFPNRSNMVSNGWWALWCMRLKQLSTLEVSDVITHCCLPITRHTIEYNYITDLVVRKKLIWWIHDCGAVILSQVIPLSFFNSMSMARCQTLIVTKLNLWTIVF